MPSTQPDSPVYWALVPAAGAGKRMGCEIPKQYLKLAGKAIISHTLERLCSVPEICGIMVCISAQDPYWETLELPAKVMQTFGGEERSDTVLCGLQALARQAHENDWVLVHDAARPCVRQSDIKKLMRELAQHPVGGLLACPASDTMKRAGSGGHVESTVNRTGLWHALTPQMFRLGALRKALQNIHANGGVVTDDAQAMELNGLMPALVEGHPDNLKITHPRDLELAELYLSRR